jgi:hypothetical protein
MESSERRGQPVEYSGYPQAGKIRLILLALEKMDFLGIG